MAITGSGTQADPWIVHDWEEFVTAVGTNQNDSYIELGNDIDAPAETTSALTITYPKQIDGKGFSINGARATVNNPFLIFQSRATHAFQYLKNLFFKDINHDSTAALIQIEQLDYCGVYLTDVDFAGYFTKGYLFKTDGGTLIYGLNVNSSSINLDVSNGNFMLNKYDYASDEFSNLNAQIRYINCSPSEKLLKKSSGTSTETIRYSTLRLYLEDTETKLDLGANLNNCYIIGKGSGIIVPSCSGVSVVENTLPLETSASNIYSLPTADMKNPQKLHDNYGFPAGVN